MKKIITIILFILTSVNNIYAQKLIPPTGPVAVGEWVQVNLVDFDETSLKTTKLHYYPRNDIKIIPAKTWGGDGIILFCAKTAGTYLIYTDNPYAECEICIGTAPGPGPGPGPPEPEPPLPGAKYQVMIFQDTDRTDNLSIDQVSMLSGLKFREELKSLGHTFVGSYNLSKYTKRTCDNGVCTETRVLPAEINQWMEWVNGTALPAVVLWDGKDGSKPIVFELPANKTEFLNRLK